MTLLELLGLLRKHLKLVIALPIICAVLAAIVSYGFLPNEYTAETSIYALTKTSSTTTSSDSVNYTDLTASQMLANDFAELVKNDQIQDETAHVLGLENLSGYKISVVSSTTTRVIKIDVTSKDPAKSALVANQLAKQVGDTAVSIMDVEAVNVISEATEPTTPSGPRRAMYTLVALLAGLFLAIALVVLRDMLNTTIRSDEEAAELLGVPVIGRFPLEKGGKR